MNRSMNRETYLGIKHRMRRARWMYAKLANAHGPWDTAAKAEAAAAAHWESRLPKVPSNPGVRARERRAYIIGRVHLRREQAALRAAAMDLVARLGGPRYSNLPN